MKRLLTSAVAASLLAAPAAYGAAVVVYDKKLGDEFAAERQIVEMAQQAYGESAVYDTGNELPEALDAALRPGAMLPDSPAIGEVPTELAGRLPHTQAGTQWVKAGNHLIEVANDGRIVMTVYEVLP